MNAVLAMPSSSFAPMIGAFARAAAGMADLALLRDIERTVESLNLQRDTFLSISANSNSVLQQLGTVTVVEGHYIDSNDQIVDSLKESAGSLEGFLARALHKKAFMDLDSRLDPKLRVASRCV